jgi:hypothetical protein
LPHKCLASIGLNGSGLKRLCVHGRSGGASSSSMSARSSRSVARRSVPTTSPCQPASGRSLSTRRGARRWHSACRSGTPKWDLAPWETSIQAMEDAAGISLPLPDGIDRAALPPSRSQGLARGASRKLQS